MVCRNRGLAPTLGTSELARRRNLSEFDRDCGRECDRSCSMSGEARSKVMVGREGTGAPRVDGSRRGWRVVPSGERAGDRVPVYEPRLAGEKRSSGVSGGRDRFLRVGDAVGESTSVVPAPTGGVGGNDRLRPSCTWSIEDVRVMEDRRWPPRLLITCEKRDVRFSRGIATSSLNSTGSGVT